MKVISAKDTAEYLVKPVRDKNEATIQIFEQHMATAIDQDCKTLTTIDKKLRALENMGQLYLKYRFN